MYVQFASCVYWVTELILRNLRIFTRIFKRLLSRSFSADIWLLKVNNRNIRIMYVICSKLAIKSLQRRLWCRISVLIVNFEQISHHFLVFLLLLWTSKYWLDRSFNIFSHLLKNLKAVASKRIFSSLLCFKRKSTLFIRVNKKNARDKADRVA